MAQLADHIVTIAVDGTPIRIAFGCNDLELSETINTAVKVLEVTKFRGTVTFVISQDGNPHWTSLVTFTDEQPAGIWRTTKH